MYGDKSELRVPRQKQKIHYFVEMSKYQYYEVECNIFWTVNFVEFFYN